MGNLEPIIIVFGTLVTTMISGVFVMLKLIVDKEQKTSEFRQAWIDSLRNEIAEYISINNVMFSQLIYAAQIDKIENPHEDFLHEFIENHHDNLIKKEIAMNAIHFRVNRKKDKNLLQSVYEIERYWMGEKEFNIMKINEDLEKLRKQTQKILKKEWERVKKGEKPYYYMKRITFIAILILAIVAGLIFNESISFSNITDSVPQQPTSEPTTVINNFY